MTFSHGDKPTFVVDTTLPPYGRVVVLTGTQVSPLTGTFVPVDVNTIQETDTPRETFFCGSGQDGFKFGRCSRWVNHKIGPFFWGPTVVSSRQRSFGIYQKVHEISVEISKRYLICTKLNKYALGITPHYHIANRHGKHECKQTPKRDMQTHCWPLLTTAYTNTIVVALEHAMVIPATRCHYAMNARTSNTIQNTYSTECSQMLSTQKHTVDHC